MRIIHGAPFARTNYIIWAMKEMGLAYEINPVNPFTGDNKKPEYLAINPNGLIPTLEEDGLILWESMAINFYLAKNYGDNILWSDDPKEEALIMQWSLFGILNLDKKAVDCMLHMVVLPKEMRDPATLKAAQSDLIPHLKILNDHLSGKKYLVAERFTIADLNVAAMLDYAVKSGYDFSSYDNLQPWLNRCLGRPIRVKMNEIK